MARVAGLDVSGIVKVALAIADREGLDKLTMRRLSTELGVTPMAIYHHVSNKEEVVDLVIDESFGQLPIVDESSGDLDSVVGWFLQLHDLLLEHPALAAAAAGRRIDGPHAASAAVALTRLAYRLNDDSVRATEMVVAAFWLTLGSGQHQASRRERPALIVGESIDVGQDSERELRDKMLARSVDPGQFERSLRTLITGYIEPLNASTER